MQVKLKVVIHYPYVYKERNEILKETVLKLHPHKGTFQCLLSIEKTEWHLRGCRYWIKGSDEIHTELPSAGYHDIMANGKFQQYPFLYPVIAEEGKQLLDKLNFIFLFYAKEKGLVFDPKFKEPVKQRSYQLPVESEAAVIKPSGTFKRFQDFKEYKAKKNT